MIVTVIGAGYVGLVSACVFADLGNTVHVIDVIPEKIENLKKGIIPIYEPGLEEIVKRNIRAKRLLFTMDYSPAVQDSQIVIIAVGTPPKEDGNANLLYIYDAAEKIAKNLKDYTVIVTKSTVPVGTGQQIQAVIDRHKPENTSYDYASIPEFLREGQAISDTFHPDRVIIGVQTKKAKEILTELHEPIVSSVNGHLTKLVITDIPTAEMIKYASNAFLATKISFANSIAQLSERTGANGVDVLNAVGLDHRIGPAFLKAGAGYGGSCFPKDVQALIAIAKNHGYDFQLLQEVENINKSAMTSIITKTEKMLNNEVKGKTIGVLGLAFKPDTDDMRFAPSIPVIENLIRKGAFVKAYDPVATETAKLAFHNDTMPTFMDSAIEAARDADVLIVITEWNEFKELHLNKIKEIMKTPKLIDCRNIYNPEKVKKMGYTYIGVGRI